MRRCLCGCEAVWGCTLWLQPWQLVRRVPALLAHSWHAQGRLADLPESEPCRRAYWLVAPLPQWRQKKVKALVAFLTGG